MAIKRFGKSPSKSPEALVGHLNQLVDAVNALLKKNNIRDIEAAPQYTGWFFAEIGGSEAVGDEGDKRWKYAWVEVTKSELGYEQWITDVDGKSGGTTTNPAYNVLEELGPEGLNVGACPVGTIVVMREQLNVDGQTEYWFSYEAPLGAGTDRYMVLQTKLVNGNLVPGWDWARLHY